MAKFKDLTGIYFNKLKVVKCIGRYKREPIWKCLCECGNITNMRSSQINKRLYNSCGGCSVYMIKTHGESAHRLNTKEYKTWQYIKQRCANQIRYINKGIKMCKDWENNYLAFLNYIGRAPSKFHSIDRIDNSKGYEPGNVRWATSKQQQSNRTNNVYYTYDGRTKLLGDWAKELNINPNTLYSRIYKQKLSFEVAIMKAIKKRK